MCKLYILFSQVIMWYVKKGIHYLNESNEQAYLQNNLTTFSTTALGNEDPIASLGNLVLHPGICQFIR